MNVDFFRAYFSLLEKKLRHILILGYLVQLIFPHNVKSAVSNVGPIEDPASQQDAGQRASHAFQCFCCLGFIVNGPVSRFNP